MPGLLLEEEVGGKEGGGSATGQIPYTASLTSVEPSLYISHTQKLPSKLSRRHGSAALSQQQGNLQAPPQPHALRLSLPAPAGVQVSSNAGRLMEQQPLISHSPSVLSVSFPPPPSQKGWLSSEILKHICIPETSA